MSKTGAKKIPLTKEQKCARGRLAIYIILIILVFFVALYFIFAAVNAAQAESVFALINNFSKVDYEGKQLVPEKDAEGFWCFETDEDFKIMQLTDVHIGSGCLSAKKDLWAINAVAAMVSADKPDLVVVSGDIVFPVPFSSGTFNNMPGIKTFVNLMEQLGVYWTFIYGNHDTEIYSYFNKEEVEAYFLECVGSGNYPHFLYQKNQSQKQISGNGNNIIKVKDTNGIVTQAIVMLDSHSYTDGDYFGILWKYDNIHQDQIDWYAEEMSKINAQNRTRGTELGVDYPEKVKNIMFFHIPLREYREAWLTHLVNEKKISQEVLTKENVPEGIVVEYYYGQNGEYSSEGDDAGQTMNPLVSGNFYGIFCGSGEDNVIEVGKENGLQGTFCGHDHLNNFSVSYNGIRLTYGCSIDYLAYSTIWHEKAQRGCTLITISHDGTMSCEASNYYQDKYKLANVQEQDALFDDSVKSNG